MVGLTGYFMPIFDHFSLIAPFYERFIPLRKDENLFRFVDLPRDGILLDAGGGTGRVSKAFQDRIGTIVIVDLSLRMLTQAGGNPGLHAVNSLIECIPFSDQVFDRVIMVDAFHHVINQRETARELWRVVRPGGRIVIEEPNIKKFSVKLVAVAEKLVLMRSHIISASKIAGLFNFPGSRTQIEYEGFNAWVIIERQG